MRLVGIEDRAFVALQWPRRDPRRDIGIRLQRQNCGEAGVLGVSEREIHAHSLPRKGAGPVGAGYCQLHITSIIERRRARSPNERYSREGPPSPEGPPER